MFYTSCLAPKKKLAASFMFELIAVTLEELMILTAKSVVILKDDCENPMLTN